MAAIVSRARAMSEARAFPAALAELERAIAGATTAEERCRSWNAKGVVLMLMNDTEGSRACFERALQAKPLDPIAIRNLGVARRAEGDLAGALEQYRQAIALGYHGAYIDVAQLREGDHHDVPAAIDAIERFLENAAPDDPDRADARAYLATLRAKRP